MTNIIKTVKILNANADVKLSFDPESKEFKGAYTDFTEAIIRGGSQEMMLIHVVDNVLRFGIQRMVEGVGYVQDGADGEIREPFSGITLLDDLMFEIEVR